MADTAPSLLSSAIFAGPFTHPEQLASAGRLSKNLGRDGSQRFMRGYDTCDVYGIHGTIHDQS